MALNEIFGWVWIVGGFLSGMTLGLRFQREYWLGGYGSFRRRMVRLGHVSFLGLGFLNILFALSAPRVRLDPGGLSIASWSLVVGGATMPLCCALMAWKRALQPAFAVPVASLLLGATLVVAGLLRP